MMVAWAATAAASRQARRRAFMARAAAGHWEEAAMREQLREAARKGIWPLKVAAADITESADRRRPAAAHDPGGGNAASPACTAYFVTLHVSAR